VQHYTYIGRCLFAMRIQMCDYQARNQGWTVFSSRLDVEATKLTAAAENREVIGNLQGSHSPFFPE